MCEKSSTFSLPHTHNYWIGASKKKQEKKTSGVAILSTSSVRESVLDKNQESVDDLAPGSRSIREELLKKEEAKE